MLSNRQILICSGKKKEIAKLKTWTTARGGGARSKSARIGYILSIYQNMLTHIIYIL